MKLSFKKCKQFIFYIFKVILIQFILIKVILILIGNFIIKGSE